MTGRTSLTRFAPQMRDPDPDGPTHAAKRAWHEYGILTILPGQLHGLDRDFADALGNRLWGKRHGGN